MSAISKNETTFSVEFFPPKDDGGVERLWAAMDSLHDLAPDFVSVTYGAGGTTRDRTIRIATEIKERTGIETVAHLTCVGSTKDELVAILKQYQSANIRSVLALRGDPVGGPSSPWVSTAGGFDHADQLVQLAADIGGFEIGVAAFPDGHPASGGDCSHDIDVLIRKQELGASFATTQFFFEFDHWQALVDALSKRGSALPIIAGILPITNIKQLNRMSELGGATIPSTITRRFELIADDPIAVQAVGVEIATELCEKLLTAGAPGLHFYTMNTAKATMEIANNLGLAGRGAR
jgi:methylenetetrahydrofolate reductase (NADPH)